MTSEISPCVEEFQIFHTTDVEESEILRNFKILHMTDVKKSEIFPAFFIFKNLFCHLRVFAWRKIEPKMEKNDKYQV